MKRLKIIIILFFAAMAVCLTAGCGNSGTSDGSYTIAVTLSGGTGKATIESPTVLTVKDGKATAKITWSSANFDYMIADGVKYTPEITDDKSVFEIPVSAFDQELKITADTTAMSQAHEIEYTLKFDSSTLKAMPGSESGADGSSSALPGMKLVHSLDLKYADQFSIDYYDGGYALISVKDTGRYLVVPSGKKTPAGLDSDITVIQQPIDHIYLAATSAMDMFRSLDSTDQITLSGVKENDWYIDEARQAMENGKMRYAGKYSAPDYELIASQNCDLAIESTMIYHTPEVREQLENLKIPVFVEHSSYESDPLARMEWIKLYGVLLGKEDQADSIFENEISQLSDVISSDSTGKTVAFFYITTNGIANIRKPGDYVVKMIEMAGGEYLPQITVPDDDVLSTMNMQMEAFYEGAKDADYIIYNSTIDAVPETLDEFLKKSSLLSDFKAVKEGHVWCTGKSLFQEPMSTGKMISDIHTMLTEDTPDASDFTFIHQLK